MTKWDIFGPFVLIEHMVISRTRRFVSVWKINKGSLDFTEFWMYVSLQTQAQGDRKISTCTCLAIFRAMEIKADDRSQPPHPVCDVTGRIQLHDTFTSVLNVRITYISHCPITEVKEMTNQPVPEGT